MQPRCASEACRGAFEKRNGCFLLLRLGMTGFHLRVRGSSIQSRQKSLKRRYSAPYSGAPDTPTSSSYFFFLGVVTVRRRSPGGRQVIRSAKHDVGRP